MIIYHQKISRIQKTIDGHSLLQKTAANPRMHCRDAFLIREQT